MTSTATPTITKFFSTILEPSGLTEELRSLAEQVGKSLGVIEGDDEEDIVEETGKGKDLMDIFEEDSLDSESDVELE